MAGYAAVHAAVEEEYKKNQEEEEMTGYRREDLEQGWEFKILRSATGQFGRPEVLARVLQTERTGGWELLEKFDNDRLRFRRPVAARLQDNMRPAGYDPYRTQHGIGEGMLVVYVIGAITLSLGLLLGGLVWAGVIH